MIELKKLNNELNHEDGSRFGSWVMDDKILTQVFILIRVFITFSLCARDFSLIVRSSIRTSGY